MSLVNLGLLLLVGGVLTFFQNDYVLDFERMEVGWSDNVTVRNLTIVTFKYNRTCPLINATGIVTTDFGNEIRVVVQAYMFRSNEYREFPLRFEFNYCDAVKKNDFGLATFYACGNFSRCPMKKGAFLMCNWSPNPSKFPPYLPNGRYLMELVLIFRSKDIMKLKLFLSVTRPLSWSKN